MVDEVLQAQSSEEFALVDVGLGGDVGDGLVGPGGDPVEMPASELFQGCGCRHRFARVSQTFLHRAFEQQREHAQRDVSADLRVGVMKDGA